MKTYLNRKGKYVNEEPEDGYFICNDRSGKKVYSTDEYCYFFMNEFNFEQASDYRIYWIEQGTVLKNIQIFECNYKEMLLYSILNIDGFRDLFIKNWKETNESFFTVYWKTFKELKNE